MKPSWTSSRKALIRRVTTFLPAWGRMENNKMEFENQKAEADFDSYAAQWLLRYRHPGTEALALVMQRAYDNLAGALPSVSAFERGYRELYAEGRLKLVTEKLVEPVMPVRQKLTVEEYRAMRADSVARKYMVDREFKRDVDSLIARKLI
jgi:hypothetical protein